MQTITDFLKKHWLVAILCIAILSVWVLILLLPKKQKPVPPIRNLPTLPIQPPVSIGDSTERAIFIFDSLSKAN